MDALELARSVLAIGIGLVLGSVLPADLLARRRSVDIRTNGDGNPGTINAIRVLGWVPGLITAAYDVSIGVVCVLVAGALGAPAGVTYLAGIAAVVGHRLPVFHGFRGGGQGMGASAGLLLYGIATAMARGSLTVADIGFLAALLLVTFALSRSDALASVVMLPFLVGRLVLARTEWQLLALVTVVAAHIWVVQVPAVRRWLADRSVRPMKGRTRG